MTEGPTLQQVLDGLAHPGEAPALIVFEDERRRTWSYRALDRIARRLAADLAGRGVGAGAPVALHGPNGIAWVAARLALLRLNAPCVPIDQDASPERLKRLLDDSGVSLLLVAPAYMEATQDALAGGGRELALVEIGWPEDAGSGAPDDGPDDAPAAASAADDVVSRFYTSGTTGPPKAVPLTQANVATNLDVLRGLDLVGPGDRVLLPLPLHHSYPFIVGLLLPLVSGATVVFPAGVGGRALAAAFRDAEVTTLVGVPRLYEALLAAIDSRLAERGQAASAVLGALWRASLAVRRRLGLRLGRYLLAPLHRALAPRLDLVVSGGARLEAETGWRLEGLGYRVLSGYGLVETTSVATFNTPRASRMGSAGRPSRAVEMRIRPVPEMEHGEIQFRGPIVFPGYAGNPEANAKSFTEDGWFRTGDLGWQDEDGFVHVVGRANEMIVLPDGKNVFPEDVEAVYSRAPLVKEMAVLERGGRLMAVVAPDLSAASGQSGFAQRIRVAFAELGRELPAYMRLADFVLTREPLPRNRLGKYRRRELVPVFERAERGEAPPPPELSAAERERLSKPRARQLMDYLARRFPDQAIGLDTSLQMELGIDSLSWVDLQLGIERRVGVVLSEEVMAEVGTVRDLLEAVEGADAADASGAERQAARDPDQEAWLAPRGRAARIAGFCLHAVARLIMRLMFRPSVTGLDRLPRSGAAIVALNHASDLDPVVVGAALPYGAVRRSWWSADAARVFGSQLGRALAGIVPIFPVDERAPQASLERAAAVLARGDMLIWFPEEWRSPTGALQPFRPGVGVLVARTGAAVVPGFISGTFEAMPRTARFPRPHPVRLSFGEPIPAESLLPADLPEVGEERHRAIADRIGAAVAELGGVDYPGSAADARRR